MRLFFSGVPKKDGYVELSPPGVSIGRELDNDVVVESEAASRYHCKVLWRDNDWFLKDLGSTNGTKLNGLKISGEAKLKEGDEIAIVYQKFIFAENPPSKNIPTSKENTSAPKESDNKSSPVADPAQKKSKDTSPQSFFGAIFSTDKDNSQNKSDDYLEKSKFFKKDEIEKTNPPSEKEHPSMLFFMIAALFAFVLIGGFFLIMKITEEQKNKTDANKNKSSVNSGTPLCVIYEKQISSPNNIFRYQLTIKNNIITVERDDLRHSIRFRRQQEISPELLENLKSDLDSTDFMSVSQPQAGISPDNNDETKILTIAYDTSLNTVKIKNAFEPTPFREAVNAIESFSSNVLNIPTISLTPEEMKKEAEDTFAKAEMLFANKNAKRENLKESIKRYSYVIELLEFFEPKPAMYDQAYKKSQEAKKLLEDEVKQYEINAQQATRMQRLQDAIEAYRSITELLDPDDKRYQTAKNKILKLEEAIRAIKKGKKK